VLDDPSEAAAQAIQIVTQVARKQSMALMCRSKLTRYACAGDLLGAAACGSGAEAGRSGV